MDQMFSYFDRHSRISDEAREQIKKICQPVVIRKNEILQPVGRTCRTIYFINSGLARIFYFKDGKDITESFSFENNMLARVDSLFTGKPSSRGIQMLETTRLQSVNATELFNLFDRFPDIERLSRIITERSYVETVNRMESLQFHTAEERYLDLIKHTPDLLKRVSLKYISSYLGITPVSLSRIRTSL